MKAYLKSLIWVVISISLFFITSTKEILGSTASILYVSTSGSDFNDCLSPATTCSSINGALNKASAGDTIRVSAETYTGTGNEVVLIEKDISLSGGWDQAFTQQIGHTVLDGQISRVVVRIPDAFTVSIEFFLVQNGYSDAAAGGVINYGILLISNCIIQNNQGTDIEGGGISSYNLLTIEWSTVRNNSGTAIYNWDWGGPLIILNSTIYNNTDGPGVRVQRQDATIINTTISGNLNNHNYYSDGGGIYFSGIDGDILLLRNVTITGNTANERGGGIHVINDYGAQVLISNSIISGNSAYFSPDCYGTLDSQGYNIIGDTFQCTFNSSTGDQLNVDPLLGLLQDNGGPTYTQWIYADSTAIDGGNPVGCLDQLDNPLIIDQRGFTRPLDGDSDGNKICDIGAYEADPENLPPNHPGSIWYVSPNGNNGNDCLSPATACKTINGALIKASAGDIVNISIGVFTAVSGNEVVLIDKNITLSGGWNSNFTEQTGYSVIDGQNTRRGITINHDLNAFLEWIYVQNGLSLKADGGGIYIGYSARVIINDSVIYNNVTGTSNPYNPYYQSGGGIGMGTFGRLTLNNSLIMGNTANDSGGGIFSGECTLTIYDSNIVNNNAGLGGGIASKIGGQIELNHSVVANNSSLNWGGGIDASDTSLIIRESSVSGNIAGGSGGGIIGHWMKITDSTINNNHGASGGGINTSYDVEISNSSILYNTATGNGGGIYSSGDLILINTTIAYNKAFDPYSNEADGGGIFRAGGAILQASNVTIARNSAERFGGGIRNQTNLIILRNSILAENQAASALDCIGKINSDGYNLLGDESGCNFIPSFGDLLNIDSGLAYPFGIPKTIALYSDSPAVDGGNLDGCKDHQGIPIIIDQINTSRPLDGDGDGNSICDVGAFEYNPSFPPQWTFLPVTIKK